MSKLQRDGSKWDVGVAAANFQLSLFLSDEIMVLKTQVMVDEKGHRRLRWGLTKGIA